MKESLHSALTSLGSNRLRTVLTIAIMATGIMALVGIQTAIEILSREVSESFGRMGASSFEIKGTPSSDDRRGSPISLRQADSFSGNFNCGEVGISAILGEMASASYKEKSSDPTLSIIASDGNYLRLHGCSLDCGRTFTEGDITRRAAVCIIGANVRRKLFGGDEPLGEYITVSGMKLRVVGAAASQGTMAGTGCDGSILIPSSAAERFPSENIPDFRITVSPREGVTFEQAQDEADVLMRNIRRIAPGAEKDYIVQKSDAAQEMLASLKSKLSLLALVIGLVTLTGSSVALMNIMLVSVKERTREIGLRKAIGAGSGVIGREFLTETILIGQAGGAAGTALGIAAGNIVAIIMEGSFAVPWKWIGISLLICLAVSLASGVLPSRKAAALNPIEALRDEG